MLIQRARDARLIVADSWRLVASMHIFLEGFKSIKDRQSIAIGNKITFLVGPNSAGKSTLIHALNKLRGDTPIFDFSYDYVYRNPRANELSDNHALGVEWTFGGEVLRYSAGHHEREGYHEYGHYVEKYINDTHLMTIYGTSELDETSVTSQKLNGTINSVFSGHTRLGRLYSSYANDNLINIGAINNTYREKLRSCAKWIIELHNLALQFHNSAGSQERCEAVKSEIKRHEDLLAADYLSWNSSFHRDLIEGCFEGKNRQKILNIFEKYGGIISRLKKEVYKKYSARYPGKNFNVSLVSAERVIPVAADLRAVYRISEATVLDNIYHQLIHSHTALAITDNQEKNSAGSQKGHLAVMVNKALSENLFTEVGYQIEVKSRALLDVDLISDLIDGNKKKKEVFDTTEFTGEMYLRDSHGRRLDFDEVGSGIGYVLPVLIESFRLENVGKYVFLQQPELHLHPALQANLSDVLIEASANKKIIIETHSEHMILRALKRIRQTSNETLKDPELNLAPDDVAINYFEPLPNGETIIHTLRVSKDGDFIDRWPHGFFSERDQELFDE